MDCNFVILLMLIATAQLLPMGSCRHSRSKLGRETEKKKTDYKFEKMTNVSNTGNHEDGSLLHVQYKNGESFKMCVNIVNNTNCTTQKVNIRYTDYPLSSSASKFPLIMSVRYNNGRQIIVHKIEGFGIIGCGGINTTLNMTHLCVKFTSGTEDTNGKVVEMIKTCDDDVDKEKSWHIKFLRQYDRLHTLALTSKLPTTDILPTPAITSQLPVTDNKTSSTYSITPQQSNETFSTHSTLSPQQGESKISLESWKIALISGIVLSIACIAAVLIGVYFCRWRITRNNKDDSDDNQIREVQRVVYTSVSQDIQTV